MKPTILKSESGFKVTCCIRMKYWLAIETNFNPLNTIDFVNVIKQITGVKRIGSVGVNPDGTGYIIMLLEHNHSVTELFLNLENEFQTYFLEI